MDKLMGGWRFKQKGKCDKGIEKGLRTSLGWREPPPPPTRETGRHRRYRPTVRFVDAHPEGHGGDDELDLPPRPLAVPPLPLRRVKLRMVEGDLAKRQPGGRGSKTASSARKRF